MEDKSKKKKWFCNIYFVVLDASDPLQTTSNGIHLVAGRIDCQAVNHSLVAVNSYGKRLPHSDSIHLHVWRTPVNIHVSLEPKATKTEIPSNPAPQWLPLSGLIIAVEHGRRRRKEVHRMSRMTRRTSREIVSRGAARGEETCPRLSIRRSSMPPNL